MHLTIPGFFSLQVLFLFILQINLFVALTDSPFSCRFHCTAKRLFQLNHNASFLLPQLAWILHVVLNKLGQCCKFLAWIFVSSFGEDSRRGKKISRQWILLSSHFAGESCKFDWLYVAVVKPTAPFTHLRKDRKNRHCFVSWCVSPLGLAWPTKWMHRDSMRRVAQEMTRQSHVPAAAVQLPRQKWPDETTWEWR